MKKFSTLVLFLFFCLILTASEVGYKITWEMTINRLLNNNSDYQQLLNQIEQEKAEARLNSSLGLFDVNVTYQTYENDIIRKEVDSNYETSNIKEEDERWQVELNKQFFPKDFDAASDNINSRIDLFRYEQELKIAKTECLSDALDDIIDWYEAYYSMGILNQKLVIMLRENELLEEMVKENIIDVEILITNLEEIEDLEKDIADLQELDNEYLSEYEIPIYIYQDMLFHVIFENYTTPDTLMFLQKVEDKRCELIDEFQKIGRAIKFNYFKVFMPEVNLSLSYNWRDTDQDWDINVNGNFKNMTRSMDEEYPEAEIELSLPFNIFSNTSGKQALLRSYRDELGYRFNELRVDWKNFRKDRLLSYHTAKQRLIRKTRLNELYQSKMKTTMEKFKAEPTLLGTNPELKLKKEKLKTEEAELDFKIAEMKYYKEIFLINSFGEEAK
jgi:hypothetical protein